MTKTADMRSLVFPVCKNEENLPHRQREPEHFADLAARRSRDLIVETPHSKSEVGRADARFQQRPVILRQIDPYAREASIGDFNLYRRMD